MDWKFTGSKPVYQQIMEQFRAAVLSGEYPPGGRVPSVRERAAEARVNPNTVQRALTELEREGFQVRYHLKGLGEIEAVRQMFVNHVKAAMGEEAKDRKGTDETVCESCEGSHRRGS